MEMLAAPPFLAKVLKFRRIICGLEFSLVGNRHLSSRGAPKVPDVSRFGGSKSIPCAGCP
jgi:hypothetical protein